MNNYEMLVLNIVIIVSLIILLIFCIVCVVKSKGIKKAVLILLTIILVAPTILFTYNAKTLTERFIDENDSVNYYDEIKEYICVNESEFRLISEYALAEYDSERLVMSRSGVHQYEREVVFEKFSFVEVCENTDGIPRVVFYSYSDGVNRNCIEIRVCYSCDEGFTPSSIYDEIADGFYGCAIVSSSPIILTAGKEPVV